ncbi:hypothetical protein [Actinophytocola sp.]|uniref:hypothetical protein n=1 Tax=Actinophytocola sp. TaxID=1872138 RepID=UPI00389996C2
MMRQDTGRAVEQILFGWTPKGGIGMRRYSIGLSDREADNWIDRLSKYNRLSPSFVDHRPWVPERAFSYFEFADRTAALLARFNSGEIGRNSSHALVGHVADLRPHAMALSTWESWYADDPCITLSPVDQSNWKHCAVRWADEVRLGAQDRRTALVALSREVLLGEATHFTVPVNVDYDPLPLLALVRNVLDPVLSAPGAEFSWTYSTYEESDTVPEASVGRDGAPRFWFVRQLPDSGQTDRRRVSIDRGVEDDAHAGLAAELVSSYLRSPDNYAAIMRDRLSGISDPGRRVAHLLDGYYPSIDPNDATRSPVAPRPREPDWPAQDETAGAVRTWPDQPVSTTTSQATGTGAAELPSPPSTPGGFGHQFSNGGPTVGGAAGPSARLPAGVDDILTRLYDGRGLTQSDVRRHVAELRRRWEAESPYETEALRVVRHAERRLGWHDRVLAGVVAGLVLVAVLVFATARREVSVPTPPPVTVTVTVTKTIPAQQTTAAPTRPGGQTHDGHR